MLLAVAVAAVSAWVPARWGTADTASLELLRGTPVNCLLLERGQWSAGFAAAASERGIATLGVVRGGEDALAAKAAGLTGLIVEGAGALPDAGLPAYRMGERSGMRFDAELVTTGQGVWPGINPVDDEHAMAAPSGGPWIDTNSGFLRFVRGLTRAPVWIGNRPPEGKAYPAARYLQAVAEAAMCGARWVVALDGDLEKRLYAGDANAVRDWRRIADMLAFVEQHREWMQWRATGQLALVQDVRGGALLSGGILDMIAVKHTPVRPVAGARMTAEELRGALMAVNVNPDLLGEEQKRGLDAFRRGGGTVLSGPADWKFPEPKAGQVRLDGKELEKLDSIWKEVNALTGRRNLGVRLFNVGSMLSNFTESPEGDRRLLHLVNYTDFAVEAITAHLLGSWKSAVLYEPGRPARELETYPVEGGTGVDIPHMGWYAILELK